MDLDSALNLNDGRKLPLFGLGLSHQQGGWSKAAINEALRCGVKLFDTARRYGSERDLGTCLQEAPKLPEGELQRTVTTKIWPGDLPTSGSSEAFCAAVRAAVLSSLENLQQKSVDNLLLQCVVSENQLDVRHPRSHSLE